MILDLRTFAISMIRTSGSAPGWIHKHKASLSDDGRSILVQLGKVDRGIKDKSLIENIDDWRLHLADWRWEQLTKRRWARWEVRRKDGNRNHLFEYQQAVWAKQIPELSKPDGELDRLTEEFDIPSLQQELGRGPDLDLFARLYKPPVRHEELAKLEDEFNVHRIRIEAVIVRYVEEMDSVQMTVEGELPQKILDTLTRDLIEKLAGLENAVCELIQL
jgi:hypothetical protein